MGPFRPEESQSSDDLHPSTNGDKNDEFQHLILGNLQFRDTTPPQERSRVQKSLVEPRATVRVLSSQFCRRRSDLIPARLTVGTPFHFPTPLGSSGLLRGSPGTRRPRAQRPDSTLCRQRETVDPYPPPSPPLVSDAPPLSPPQGRRTSNPLGPIRPALLPRPG